MGHGTRMRRGNQGAGENGRIIPPRGKARPASRQPSGVVCLWAGEGGEGRNEGVQARMNGASTLLATHVAVGDRAGLQPADAAANGVARMVKAAPSLYARIVRDRCAVHPGSAPLGRPVRLPVSIDPGGPW